MRETLTFNTFREAPMKDLPSAMTRTATFFLRLSELWLGFNYIKLAAFYLLPWFFRQRVGKAIISLFWLLLVFMCCVLVAYVFIVFSWIILGAVIRPEIFLPYCTAVATLIIHARATGDRLT